MVHNYTLSSLCECEELFLFSLVEKTPRDTGEGKGEC